MLLEQKQIAINIVQEPQNYWWLLLIGLVPVLIKWWLNRKGKK